MLVVSESTFSTSIIITRPVIVQLGHRRDASHRSGRSTSPAAPHLAPVEAQDGIDAFDQKPWVCPLYSVTIMISRGVSAEMPEYRRNRSPAPVRRAG